MHLTSISNFEEETAIFIKDEVHNYLIMFNLFNVCLGTQK